MRRFGLVLTLVFAALAAQPARALAGGEPAPPASLLLIAGTIDGKAAYGCAVIVAADARTVTLVTAKHNLAIADAQYILTTGERLEVVRTRPLDAGDLTYVDALRPHRTFAVAEYAPVPAAGETLQLWGPIANVPFTPHAARVRLLDARITDAPIDSLALDCPDCDHGDSGTGVFDARGRLIGIITRGYYADGRKLLVLAEVADPVRSVADRP
jgi:hypothetical protein